MRRYLGIPTLLGLGLGLGRWQEGDPEAGWGFAPNTFGILTTAPQLAQAYFPTLTYHPQ